MLAILPIKRMSWLFLCMWIITPAVIKRRALNIACEIKWKKANWGCFIPSAIIMIPNCLSVLRAMIFFKSFSERAEILAVALVSTPMKNSLSVSQKKFLREGKKLMMM